MLPWNELDSLKMARFCERVVVQMGTLVEKIKLTDQVVQKWRKIYLIYGKFR